jgi:hypothetical protein
MRSITYSAVRNPKWMDAEHTLLECEVNFDHITFEEWSSFGAVASGDLPHTHEIFARAVAGDFGPIAEFVDPDAPPAAPEDQQPDSSGLESF